MCSYNYIYIYLLFRMKIVTEFDMAVDGTLLTLRTDSAPFLPLAEEPQKRAEKRFKQIQEWIKSSAGMMPISKIGYQ